MDKTTFGAKRVHAEFNPDKNEAVDRIKNLAAQLIDEVNDLRSPTNQEKNRCIIIALEKIETGTMYAVKANFKQ